MQKRSHKSGTLGMGLWNGEDGKAEKEFIVLEGGTAAVLPSLVSTSFRLAVQRTASGMVIV